MSLIELQNKIHEQNKDMGWWDEPRPFSTFVCLFHSELSEAMEGDRKGLMDDHLPKYEMFWVELADFVIRVLDYASSIDLDCVYYQSAINYIQFESDPGKKELLASLHSMISELYRTENHQDNEESLCGIASAVVMPISYSSLHGVDLHKIILEKVEYNKHRADHKRENRAKEGGKRY